MTPRPPKAYCQDCGVDLGRSRSMLCGACVAKSGIWRACGHVGKVVDACGPCDELLEKLGYNPYEIPY